MGPRRTLISLAIAAVAIACGRGSDGEMHFGGDVFHSWNPVAVKEVRGVPAAAIQTELKKALATKPADVAAEEWRHVKGLYNRYQSSPLWLDDDGLIRDRADALVDALVNATTDAIDIDHVPLYELAVSLDSVKKTDKPTAPQLARADLLMTRAYTSLSEDYLRGMLDPATVNQSWHIDPMDDQIDSALVRSLADKNLADAIGRMRPADYDYDMLRRKLEDYRRIAQAGGWSPIPAGKAVKRGQTDSPARLAALRARLRAEGIQVDSTAPNVYDQSFAAAVAQFQQRHAIGVDSMLGSETLDALNVSATFRLEQIAANLERFRWLPRSLGARHIVVNVPAFRLEGFENGKKTIEMKVIVGAEYEGRATPVFSDKMETVVFRPYWDVPDKIAENELLPKGIPADFEETTQGGKLHLRQRPGPKNALGLVKFLFPNDFNIYFHDTPQDNLFKKDVRAFSHGCIRLEKPDELAEWVLGWDASRVHQAMENGPDNRAIPLPKKIPVYITYMTAYMRDGQLWFGNDLYHRDDQLVQAVAGGAKPSGNAVRGIEALRTLTK